MRKFALLFALLSFLTYGTTDLTARTIGITNVVIKDPVKNIPAPVLRSLEHFLSTIDVTEYELEQVTRNKNTFTITITTVKECGDVTMTVAIRLVILSNGKIIRVDTSDCIKVPPDAVE